MLECMVTAAENKVWREASKHRYGGGLESGTLDLDAALSVQKWCQKHDLAEEAMAVEVLATGGANLDYEGCLCQCGAPATARHVFWECPRLETHQCEHIAKTNWMVRLFQDRERRRSTECLWARGLTPRHLLDIGKPRPRVHEVATVPTSKFQEAAARSKDIFTDGAGAKPWMPQSRPHAGARVTAFDLCEETLMVSTVEICGVNVPGRQTAPRAETIAASVASEAAGPRRAEDRATVWPGAIYVTNGMQGIVDNAKLHEGANGDLWRRAFETASHTTWTRTPAHIELGHVRRSQVSIKQFVRNAVADDVAGAMAEAAARDDASLVDISQWEAYSFLIARRLAFIVAERWRGRDDKVADVEMMPLQEAAPWEVRKSALIFEIGKQGHDLFQTDDKGGSMCSICRRKKSAKGVQTWCKTPRSAARRAAGPLAATTEGSQTSGPVVRDSIDRTVSRGTRAKHVAKARSTHLENRRDLKRLREDGRERLATAWPLVALQGMIESQTPPPEPVSSGHALVECGGFIGCARCAGWMGFRGDHPLLTNPCRGYAPKGSRGPITRIAKGLFPLTKRQATVQVWPWGEASPAPRAFPFDASGIVPIDARARK